MLVVLVQGIQLNWSALMKEAYIIYRAVKKLSFYLADATITLQGNHSPLKRFPQKTILNAKVNNRGKLSDYNIKFKFINGIKNTLAKTLFRLINLELTELNSPEKEGYEYGYAIFEQLPDIYVDCSKCTSAPPENISNLNDIVMEIVTQYNRIN